MESSESFTLVQRNLKKHIENFSLFSCFPVLIVCRFAGMCPISSPVKGRWTLWPLELRTLRQGTNPLRGSKLLPRAIKQWAQLFPIQRPIYNIMQIRSVSQVFLCVRTLARLEWVWESLDRSLQFEACHLWCRLWVAYYILNKWIICFKMHKLRRSFHIWQFQCISIITPWLLVYHKPTDQSWRLLSWLWSLETSVFIDSYITMT